MGVDLMMNGRSSPRKQEQAPTGRIGRRLTIHGDDHPCAENRTQKLPSSPPAHPIFNSNLPGVHGSNNNNNNNNVYSNPNGYQRKPSVFLNNGYSARKGSIINNNGYRKSSFNGDSLECGGGGGVSFLTVPQPNMGRRPSTADIMIEKLQVERHEGGGLSISGVALSAHCHLTLIICGAFCLLAGVVLTYVAYVNQGRPYVPTTTPIPTTTGPLTTSPTAAALISTTVTSKKSKTSNNEDLTIVGPLCIVLGLIMIIIGLLLFALGKKIQKDEKEDRRRQSEAQMNEMRRSFSIPTSSPLHTSAPSPDQPLPILSLRRNSWWIEPNPVDVSESPAESPTSASSTRSGNTSRTSSPVTQTGRRGSTAVPVWTFSERLDVGSFPTDELTTPSKMKRVAESPEEEIEDNESTGEQENELPTATQEEDVDHNSPVNLDDQQPHKPNPPIQINDTDRSVADVSQGRSLEEDSESRIEDRNLLQSQCRSMSGSFRTPVLQVTGPEEMINLPYQVPSIEVTHSSCNTPRPSSQTRQQRHSLSDEQDPL